MRTFTKLLSLLCCALMLFGAVACGGQNEQETENGTLTETVTESGKETEGAEGVQNGSDSEENSESETESKEATELVVSVTEKDGEATVTLENGFSYTAKNYSALSDGVFTVNRDFEILFPEAFFAENFNRVHLRYRATATVKVVLYFTLDGELNKDYFFLDAHKQSFSGLISAYLDGKCGAKLERMVLETCDGSDAQFILGSVETEVLPLYDDDLFVENDRFKIGVRLSWGGSMTYFEDKNDGIDDLGNLVNIHDEGRVIQQSFYGVHGNSEQYTGGTYNGSVWPYNPVQAGNRFGKGTPHLIDVEVGEDYIYILAQSLDWAQDSVLTYTYYENRYTVKEDHVLVDNVATDYSGYVHDAGGQEIPAVYLISYFDTLSYYNGASPWTGDKEGLHYVDDLGGWSESGHYYFARGNSETWATWINTEDNFALGIYCPNVDKLIAIRHQYNGSKDPMNNSTTYVAPSSSITMQAYKPIVYSYILASGTPEEVREVFAENKDFTDNASLSEDKFDQRVSIQKMDMSNLDFTKSETCEILCGKSNTEVTFKEELGATEFYLLRGRDPYVTLDFTSNSDRVLNADDYNTVEFEYMIPVENGRQSYTAVLFLCSGDVKSASEQYTVNTTLIVDGQYHTASLYLPNNKWSGEIHKIRFDFFGAGDVGDKFFIKSFRFTNMREIAVENDMTEKGSELIFASNKNTAISFDDEVGAVKLEIVDPNDVNVELNFSNLAILAEEYPAIEIEYMLPVSNSTNGGGAGIYFCAGEDKSYSGSRVSSGRTTADGQWHTLTISFEGKSGWSGEIKSLRFDYFENTVQAGDLMYIKSIKLVEAPGFAVSLEGDENGKVFSSERYTKVYFDENEGNLCFEVDGGSDVGVVIDLGAYGLSTEDYTKMIVKYMIPKTNSKAGYSSTLYFSTDESSSFGEDKAIYTKYTVDGKYHTLVIDLSQKATWTGKILKLRFDYFQSECINGDVIYIESISLK